jgi:hypothetical protein
MINKNRPSVKSFPKKPIALSGSEANWLRYQVHLRFKNTTLQGLYTVLGLLDPVIYFSCLEYGAVKRKDKANTINFDRLNQLIFTSVEGNLSIELSTKHLRTEHIPQHYPQAATSVNTVLKYRNALGNTYFEELDLEELERTGKKSKKMVLNEDANPETGEFEEKVIQGLGLWDIVQPKSQVVIGKDGTEKAAGITVQKTRYERINLHKCLVVFKEVYRIAEARYNALHKHNPQVSFYDQLPEHKCNFVRNLWNVLSVNEDFEGNLLSEEYRDFVFQYPETLVERIPSTFIHVWKEGCTLAKEAWEAMQKWSKAIPSWRKNNPYPEAEVREWEFAVIDF